MDEQKSISLTDGAEQEEALSTEQDAKKRKKMIRKSIITMICTVLVLGGLTFWLFQSGFFQKIKSIEDLQNLIKQYGAFSYGIFFLIELLSVVLAPIPNNILSLAGATVLGTWPAFFLTYGAITLGSIIVFGVARVIGRPFVEKLVETKLIKKYEAVLDRKTEVFLATTFLLPLFPDDVICILAGITKVKWQHFLLLLVLFRPWGLLVACVLGGNWKSLPLPVLIALGVLFVAIFILAMKYGDVFQNKVIEKLQKRKEKRKKS
ncbi:MAG: TVP38/TMEM64 family protein [Lachnospiraceae bacterium]|nr:TVP38/TMEM64 family protein [Lachnospiraceae bacterium]